MLNNIRSAQLAILLLIPHASIQALHTDAKPPYYISDLHVGAVIAISALLHTCSFYVNIALHRATHASKIKNKEKMHDFTFDFIVAPYEERLQKYLQNIALTHHNLKGVNFLPTDEENNYYTDSAIDTIYIRKDHYEYLLYRMNPNHIFIETEQELKNVGLLDCADLEDELKSGRKLIGILHIDGTFKSLSMPLDIDDRIEAILHHELGHVKHTSTTTTFLLDQLRTWTIVFPFMKLYMYSEALKIYPRSMVGSLDFNYKAIFTSITSTIAAYTIYRQYDEIRADDSVPNYPEKLRALEHYFRKEHNELMEAIKTSPSSMPFSIGKILALAIPYRYWEKYPRLTNLFHLLSDHPSDYFRAERFKKRLDSLQIGQSVS